MDPYLEHPTLWADVHDSLIAAIRDAIVPLIAPKYFVGIQRHAYLLLPGEATTYIGKPDVTVGLPSGPLRMSAIAPAAMHPSMIGVLEVDVPMEEEIDENYLEVREVKTGKLITTIEVLSQINKLSPEGRQEYIGMRNKVLRTRSNLVEIDLLRQGKPMMVYGDDAVSTHYRILVSPGWRRPHSQLFAFDLQQPIPSFPLPLQRDEAQPIVPLNEILHELYTRARFDLRLDYQETPPAPRLSVADAQWVRETVGSFQ